MNTIRIRHLALIIGRNVIGMLCLLLLHYATDRYYIGSRTGVNQGLPYLLLVGLYGWIVFHNLVLFKGLYLRNKKGAYAAWLLVALTLTSINMVYVLRTQFGVTRWLPHLVSYLLYTGAGLGVFVLFRQTVKSGQPTPPSTTAPEPTAEAPANLDCQVNGQPHSIPVAQIQYVASLENYVQIHLSARTLITRLTMKEAENRLSQSAFVRISKTHLVNPNWITAVSAHSVQLGEQELRIGKVYKRHVAEQLAKYPFLSRFNGDQLPAE